ncbi:MAG: TRAP transporter small permease subunit [Dehalococcoidia bacterium]|nr:TRAP transporter small permease subunit [Chloroflexota bacterium]MCK4222466.1 TRAP transporter small permease subunit [Dehalococcoidia bacterium]MCK4262503.1 TRAP transporter small permease subunit [Dehalococcoidia bacterium]
MRKILKAIDSVNEWVGTQMKWLVFAIIVVCISEVISRYVFNKPTIQLPCILVMTAASLYALSFGYILLHKGHVRVDVLYARLSQRTKAVFDVVLTLLFFFPVIGLLTYAAGEWMWYAWSTGERSQMTYWYPILGPVRTTVFAGMLIFLLQGVAQFIRDLHFALRSRPYD